MQAEHVTPPTAMAIAERDRFEKSSADEVLKVRDLRVEIKATGKPVVQEVSFGLAPGQILGLVGESGSGKTTVGLALLGYCRRGLAIGGGSVQIDGQDILALDEAAQRTARGSIVSYMPQDPATALNPFLKVGTQLREAFQNPMDISEELLLQRLEEVRLPKNPRLLHAFPHQLSGGQQQRVALAIAFSNRPRLIVMDEPTTGLDVTTQDHVLKTIRQLCRDSGVSAVYVSHDLAVVANLADTVAVMYSGRIVEFGSTQSVLRRPGHPYTQALLRAVPDIERSSKLVGLAGHPPAVGSDIPACSFADRCQQATEECRSHFPAPVWSEPDHFVRCIHGFAPYESSPQGGYIVRSASNDEPLLDVENLGAWHGPAKILHGINLSLSRGNCLALVGESGSGKTTLSRCIAGLHGNNDGKMTFLGAKLSAGSSDRRPDLRRKIQYIFQNPYASLNPRRTIGDSLAAAVKVYGERESRKIANLIEAALLQVVLPADIARKYPHQLSGGQRQRVAIARALLAEPDLLICDEITSALDVSVQASVVELLRELKEKRGLGLVFVTHNLPLVTNIADSIAVMEAGRIVEQGPLDVVLRMRKSAETRRLLDDAPRFH